MSVTPPPSEPEFRAEHESFSDMFKSLGSNLTLLIQQEVDLAKAELRETSTKTKKSASILGKGAGMLAGAGIAALFILLFFSLALMWGLASFMQPGWAALIVALIWVAITATLAVLGRNSLDRGKAKLRQATTDPLHHTRETAAEFPETVNPTKETR